MTLKRTFTSQGCTGGVSRASLYLISALKWSVSPTSSQTSAKVGNWVYSLCCLPYLIPAMLQISGEQTLISPGIRSWLCDFTCARLGLLMCPMRVRAPPLLDCHKDQIRCCIKGAWHRSGHPGNLSGHSSCYWLLLSVLCTRVPREVIAMTPHIGVVVYNFQLLSDASPPWVLHQPSAGGFVAVTAPTLGKREGS